MTNSMLAVVAMAGLAGAATSAALAPAVLRFTPAAASVASVAAAPGAAPGSSGRQPLPADQPSVVAGSSPARLRPSRLGSGELGWVVALAGLGGVVAAVTAWRSAGVLLPLEVLLAVALVPPAVVDLRVGRLPNTLVLPATAAVLALLLVVEAADPAAGSVAGAVAAYAAVLVVATAAALLLPRSLGMGDTRYLALAVLGLAYPEPMRVVALFLTLLLVQLALLGWVWWTGALHRPVPGGPATCLSCLIVLWLPGLS